MCKYNGTVISKDKYSEILDKKLAKIKEACPTIYANAEKQLKEQHKFLVETLAYKDALYNMLKHLDETSCFIYIFDYSRNGIYKILLSTKKYNEIQKELIERNYLDKYSSIPLFYDDILYYYGFKESNCSYMVTEEDLEIQLIDKPLK